MVRTRAKWRHRWYLRVIPLLPMASRWTSSVIISALTLVAGAVAFQAQAQTETFSGWRVYDRTYFCTQWEQECREQTQPNVSYGSWGVRTPISCTLHNVFCREQQCTGWGCSSSSSASSWYPDRCIASCPDGTRYRTCTSDGQPIYYFADPCLGHYSTSSSSSRSACVCTLQFDPVCGVNGKTYSNSCFAHCANTDIAYDGACRFIASRSSSSSSSCPVPLREDCSYYNCPFDSWYCPRSCRLVCPISSSSRSFSSSSSRRICPIPNLITPPPGCSYRCNTGRDGCSFCSLYCSSQSSSRSCVPVDRPPPPSGCRYACTPNPAGICPDQSCRLVCARSSRSSSSSSVSWYTGGCKRSGCSGQLCVDENEQVFTTCDMWPGYACYRDARCERQQNGQCGWTQTADLRSCLWGG